MKPPFRESTRRRAGWSGPAAGIFLAAIASGLGQPVVITNQPQTQAVAPGASATFSVGASGSAPLAYQWQGNPGTGFANLADCTNAVLALTNVQAWDAADYRVIVTNDLGATSSAVAHLYVMLPALLTNRVDLLEDNGLTNWTIGGAPKGTLRWTNHQLTLRASFPGIVSTCIHSSWFGGMKNVPCALKNGQTVELRTGLVSLDAGATNFAMLWFGSTGGTYGFLKGADCVFLSKWGIGGWEDFVAFFYEKALPHQTNVLMSMTLTCQQSDLIITARLLDMEHPDRVLFERNVVDTPRADSSLTSAEFQALSGMSLRFVPDTALTPFMFGQPGLVVFQYTDGKQPPIQATFDSFELLTYRVPVVRYVNANSANPTPPYTNWAGAARVIQDAADAAVAGDVIMVTNGFYATGGRAVGTNLLVNRVAVDKPLALRSVNGPQVTVIQGYQVPGTTNGDDAIRCVYLTNGASLFGFTLTNGATRTNWDNYCDLRGGGVWCESPIAADSKSPRAVVSNCVITGNSALDDGGGAYCCTLYNCTLTGNAAGNCGGGASDSTLSNCMLNGNSAGEGGGAAFATLNNCVLTGNSASVGGGSYTYSDTLNNCTLTGNSAGWQGGGAAGGTLNNCTVTGNLAGDHAGGVGVTFASGATLNNCIVYFNTASQDPNYFAELNYSCTTPMPPYGVGNITNAPLFVDYAGGNLRLQSNSPCINAGDNSSLTYYDWLSNAWFTNQFDLDANPRIASGTVDIGAYEYQGTASVISYAWLQQYGLPTDGSADYADPDQDGMNNWQEWVCGTCPTNAQSALRLRSAAPAGTNVTVTWQSVAGVSYFLERSTNLAATPPFSLLATNLSGQSGATSFTDTNAAGGRLSFYRVGVQRP